MNNLKITTINDVEKQDNKIEFIINLNNELEKFNIPSTIIINNITEFNSLKDLVNNSNKSTDIVPSWITSDLISFVNNQKDISKDLSLTDDIVIPVSTNTFDYLNNNYDLEYEKTKLILEYNTQLKKFNIPTDITINNITEYNSFNKLVKNYVYNPLLPNTLISWLNNPSLTKFVKDTEETFNNLIDPTKNIILNDQLSIDNNLQKFKELLNIDIVPTLDQLTNLINLPSDFDSSKLTDLLKMPNINLDSLDSLTKLLKLPNIDLNNFLPDLTLPSLPNIPPFTLPNISNISSGLNFGSMLSSLSNAQLKDFPESSKWEDVVKFQAAEVTKAIFNQLSKMTLYIEPGEIKVLTNGSPSTHQGQNINRIKIKLK